MKSFVVSFLLFALCNTLGNAQGKKPRPTAVQKTQLLQKNYNLIEKLVDNSLKLTKQTDPLSRSENFRATFLELEQQILLALRERDPNRLVELNEHLQSLSSRGLLPNVGAARESISENHPNEIRLFEVRDLTERIIGNLREAIDRSSLVNTEQANQLLQTLSGMRSDLEKRMEKKENR